MHYVTRLACFARKTNIVPENKSVPRCSFTSAANAPKWQSCFPGDGRSPIKAEGGS